MARPLTLLVPVKPGFTPQQIALGLGIYGKLLFDALNEIGTVHFARALILDRSVPNLQVDLESDSKGPFVIAVITEYDGDFDRYVHDFVGPVGKVFDALLGFVDGGDQYIPVGEHEAAFRELLAANDASYKLPVLFQAYTAEVQDIREKFPPVPIAPESTPNG